MKACERCSSAWATQPVERARIHSTVAEPGAMPRARVNTANAADFLPRIEAPVLGLYPTGGPITDAEQERMLTTNIRNLRLVHLPTSFHKVQLVFAATCANAVLNFISQHDGVSCHEV